MLMLEGTKRQKSSATSCKDLSFLKKRGKALAMIAGTVDKDPSKFNQRRKLENGVEIGVMDGYPTFLRKSSTEN